MTDTALPWTPACLDGDDLAGWATFNGRLTTHRATSPCVDCTPAFADEMRPLGRCNGTPGTDIAMPPRRRGRRPNPIRVPEEDPVTAPAPPAIPCGDCLHFVVCGLKARLPDGKTTDVDELAPGLRVAYHVVVECDHYRVEPGEPHVPSVRESSARLGITMTEHNAPDIVHPAPFEDDLEARRKKVAANLTQASRQRGADANRARAAGERATKDARAIALLRQHEGNAEAVGQAMGVTGTAVRGWVARMTAAGTLPDDVAALCAGRARKARAS